MLGIDPGGQFSGIVLRRGDELVAHKLVRRDKLPVEQRGIRGYMRAVASEASSVLLDHVGRSDGHGVPGLVVAVEGVNPPTGKLGMIRLGGLIDTAMLAGYLIATPYRGGFNAVLFYEVALVPPGQNGSGPLIAYPAALRPTRGQGKGSDLLKHCRSAWDVAGVSPALLAA